MYIRKTFVALCLLLCLLLVSASALAWPKEGVYRHQMEEARIEGTVGGVSGSPYIINRLFIGFRYYDMWLYNGDGMKLNFKETLKRNADKSIDISLQATKRQPSGLRLRTDDITLYALHHCGIGTITLKNADGSVCASYPISELREYYKKYDLMPFDLLCVGGDEDPVEKLASEGRLVAVDDNF